MLRLSATRNIEVKDEGAQRSLFAFKRDAASPCNTANAQSIGGLGGASELSLYLLDELALFLIG